MVFHNRQSQTQMILASQVPDAVKYTNTNTVFKWKWAKMDEVDEYVWKWMIINGWKWSPKKNFTEHWNWISVGDYGTLRTGDIEDRRLWGQATLRTGDFEDRWRWGQATLRTDDVEDKFFNLSRIMLKMQISQPWARRAHRNPPNWLMFPNVGSIYPIKYIHPS